MTSHPVIKQLSTILAFKNILTDDKKTAHYRSGWRSGEGSALAVIFPQTLLEYWRVLEVCVASNCIIVMQAANTGLTEGSAPNGHDYDRDVIVINTLAMDELFVLGQGEQVISFPGASLHKLEKVLKPLNRAPHSVIGSSCLGASIVGGIANNSGGALVKRGPAYTELSLFAQVNAQGELVLVNHLGINLGEAPEEILTNLMSGKFERQIEIEQDQQKGKHASARDYESRLRDVDADSPSRYNADRSRLYEASGCAGKIAIFAVRLDTFEIPKTEQTFYIGTNDPDVLTKIRRDILTQFAHLPEVGEYLHRDAFDIAKEYGKDTFLSIKHLGTDFMPSMFAAKGRIDAVLNRLSIIPNNFSDKVMQFVAKLFPSHLNQGLMRFRDRYTHHLILKMSDGGIAEAQQYLAQMFSEQANSGEFVKLNHEEASQAFLLRFAAAGAAIRYQVMHEQKVGEILALDIALRRNDCQWVEVLPDEIAEDIERPLYYGHFFCHVFHQDYILKKGSDPQQVKAKMLALLDKRGAKYPAEHNVGHMYEADKALKDFYRDLDPTNTFNPGIGKMDKHQRNCACCS
ncbi:D-lactate dehydrogenase [Agaribacter flavus]|uniref:Quinone-dependent D-lactate dehydrogenase n=1 Tax=Agaribacter flavus TaxID=1902781 RepID=A0ABV7FPJ6_9ALTE